MNFQSSQQLSLGWIGWVERGITMTIFRAYHELRCLLCPGWGCSQQPPEQWWCWFPLQGMWRKCCCPRWWGAKGKRKTNLILCGIWDFLLPVNLRWPHICIAFTYPRGSSLKNGKKITQLPKTVIISYIQYPRRVFIKSTCTILLRDGATTGHSGFCMWFYSFPWGKGKVTSVTYSYWLWK